MSLLGNRPWYLNEGEILEWREDDSREADVSIRENGLR